MSCIAMSSSDMSLNKSSCIDCFRHYQRSKPSLQTYFEVKWLRPARTCWLLNHLQIRGGQDVGSVVTTSSTIPSVLTDIQAGEPTWALLDLFPTLFLLFISTKQQDHKITKFRLWFPTLHETRRCINFSTRISRNPVALLIPNRQVVLTSGWMGLDTLGVRTRGSSSFLAWSFVLAGCHNFIYMKGNKNRNKNKTKTKVKRKARSIQ